MDKRYHNPDFGYGCSRNYFSTQVLPVKAELIEETIAYETSYSQRDGIEMIYIKKGTGNLVVNNENYFFKEGDCFSVYFYGFIKFRPDQNSTVTVIKCFMEISSYLFIYQNPYYICQSKKFDNIVMLSHFKDDNKISFESLLNELGASLISKAPYQEYSSYFHLVEIWGNFIRNGIEL